MEAFCKVHSKCMDSLADDGTAKEVLECWGVALENKTYMLYSSKDFTPCSTPTRQRNSRLFSQNGSS
ncbi:hypothetical protein MTO96_010615 [Rhipicephalus appendiculatus]